MTYRYLIFWCIFVVETCRGTILTNIKGFNVEAARYPDTLPSFNQFSEKEVIKDETGNKPDADPINLSDETSLTKIFSHISKYIKADLKRVKPASKIPFNFLGDETSLTKICSQISEYIKADLKRVKPASNRCDVEFQELEDTLEIRADRPLYVDFWKYFTGKSKPESRFPIHIHIRGQRFIKKKGVLHQRQAKDMVFYDASRDELHFETRYGPLRHLRQLAKKPSTFPNDESILFDKLNEKAELHKNMDDNTREANLELRENVSSYMALYMGAVYQHQIAGSYYFLSPAPGFQIEIRPLLCYSDFEELSGLYFGRTTWNPVYVYRLRYARVESVKIEGKYPEDMYFYEVKHRTHGTLEDFSSRYDLLKKILK